MTRRILSVVPGLRERPRADGTSRIWWEPSAPARKAGFEAVDLSAFKIGDAQREAKRLNADAARALQSGLRKPVKSGVITLADVARDYQTSRYYTDLSPKTQKGYAGIIATITDKWGQEPVASLSKPVMSTWYETLRDTGKTRMAQLTLSVMSILMSHAELRGYRAEGSNPCFRLRITTPQPRARVVTWDELDALIAAAHARGLPSMAVAIALSYFAGQRETDVMQARRGDFAQTPITLGGKRLTVWVWSLIRQKRKTAGAIPLHDELAPVVAAILNRPAPADANLLVEERVGRPYDEDLFAKRWAEVRMAAAVTCPSVLATDDHLQFRDLRRSFGVAARQSGASREDVGGVLGNTAATDPRLERTYMPPDLHTTARAVNAVQRPKKPSEGRKKA